MMTSKFPSQEDFERMHDRGAVDRITEHGQEWLVCKHCGAIASIFDIDDDRESWEEIDAGDESCRLSCH